MFEPSQLIWLVPGLPLLAVLLTLCCGLSTSLRKWSFLPLVVALPLACVTALSLIPVVAHAEESHHVIETAKLTWFSAGNIQVNLQLAIDPLTAVMLSAITFVGSLIALFSIGYMRGDPGYTRYFTLMALFVFSMTILVLGNNFLILFAGWEGVGVCSYLLVGYWYAKPSAAAAARKAFLVTRLGDVGLILGIFLLWNLTGYSLDFATMFDQLATLRETHSAELTSACLLLFCGAVGKSAQFPLYVWLPDAMEGPTPVSALIHAATMVTAGVYLVARCLPLFVLSPYAQIIIAIIGVTTAFIAAFIALSQYDLKRVLAYSTISQLGFMFFALGCANGPLASFAVTAAIFHLFTHAFFKAGLFLSAGSVMHAMGDVIDMRKFSGLRKMLPVTHFAFLCGSLALAGIPVFSGFWSKEEIFASGLLACTEASGYQTTYGVLLGVALLTAGLTAFYTFRAYFKTFWGPEKVPAHDHSHDQDHGHAHDHAADHNHEPWVMKLPLIILGLGSLAIGGILGPLTHSLAHFLEEGPSFVKTVELAGEMGEHQSSFGLMVVSIVLALTGVGVAYSMFGKASKLGDQLERSAGLLGTYSHARLYMDEIFGALLVKPMEWIALLGNRIDQLIDGMGRLISTIPQKLGEVLQPIQIGLVQFYALAMVTGLVGFLCFLVLSTSK